MQNLITGSQETSFEIFSLKVSSVLCKLHLISVILLFQKQYEDYIERNYPQWKERVTGKLGEGLIPHNVPLQQVCSI